MTELFAKHKAEVRQELLKKFDEEVKSYFDLDMFMNALPSEKKRPFLPRIPVPGLKRRLKTTPKPQPKKARRKMSAAARKATSLRMKKYWADKRRKNGRKK